MERVAGRGWTFAGRLPACPPEAPVRWGGFALVAGGVLGVVAGILSLLLAFGVLSPLSPGYEYYEDYYRGKRLLNALYDLPAPVGTLLVAAGLGGLYALLAGRPKRRLAGLVARAGVVLVVSSALFMAGPGLYRALTQPPPFPYGPPEGPTLSEIFSVVASFEATAGVLMLGIAALRARGLGRWSSLPLVLGVLGAPWPYLLSPGEVPVTGGR